MKNKIDNQMEKRRYIDIDALSEKIVENKSKSTNYLSNNEFTNTSISSKINSKIETNNINDSCKKSFYSLLNYIKNNIIFIVLLSTLIKIIIHFFIFPTEVSYINTNKKIFIQTEQEDREAIFQENYDELEKKYNKKELIILGDNLYYYPEEKKRVSIAKHIESTFSDKTWLFPCILFLLVLVWIMNNSEKRKNDLYSYLLPKNPLLVIVFFGFLIILNSILEKTEKIIELSQIAVMDANTAVDIAEKSLKIAENASSEAEDAYSIAEDANDIAEDANNMAEDASSVVEDIFN